MDYQVIVVGGGPVGMMLAAELALSKVKVCVIERLMQTSPYSRALTIHPRTLEMFDMRGLKARMLDKGRPLPIGHFAALDTRLNFSVLDSSSNYTLFLPQHDTEVMLEEWASSLGVEIRRGEQVVSVRQDRQGVQVVIKGLDGDFELTASYVVGADGAGSIVRKQAGIPFAGTDESFTAVLGDVVLANPPESKMVSQYTENGLCMIVPVTAELHRVILIDPNRMTVSRDVPVTLEELSASLIRILGTDFGISQPYWMSRFGNATRQAERYREGRVFLAGDAAHIHFPAGGQGLNVGLQEAMNLGWKLAAELNGWAPDWLLDTYHSERLPINTALLRNTEAQTLLLMGEFSSRMNELRKLMSGLLQIPEANLLLASQLAAFNIQYEPDKEASPHPLNGQRLADLALRFDNGTSENIYSRFHSGSCILLHLASDERFQAIKSGLKHNNIEIVCAMLASDAAAWENVHTAFIRPDGYVAWAVSRSEEDPVEAIKQGVARWCGGFDHF